MTYATARGGNDYEMSFGPIKSMREQKTLCDLKTTGAVIRLLAPATVAVSSLVPGKNVMVQSQAGIFEVEPISSSLDITLKRAPTAACLPDAKRRRVRTADTDDDDNCSDDDSDFETFDTLTYERGVICLIKLMPAEENAPFLVTSVARTQKTLHGFWIYLPKSITYDDGRMNEKHVFSNHKAAISMDAVMHVWPPKLWAEKFEYEPFTYDFDTNACLTDMTAANVILGWAMAAMNDLKDARHCLCYERDQGGHTILKYDAMIQTLSLCGRARGNVSQAIQEAVIIHDEVPTFVPRCDEDTGQCYACRCQKNLSAIAKIDGADRRIGRACAFQMLRLRKVVRALEEFMMMELDVNNLSAISKQLAKVSQACDYDNNDE